MTEATLFSLLLFNQDENTSMYHEEYALGSFNYFKRTSIQEVLRFLSTRVVQNLEVEVPQELIHKVDEGLSFKFFVKQKGGHIFVTGSLLKYPSNTLSLLIEEVAAFIAAQAEQRQRAVSGGGYLTAEQRVERERRADKEANQALSKYLKEQLSEFQDFKQKDIMLQIKNELGKVEAILTKTIENALGRGAKLDELINSTDSLSFHTKSLYRQSQKQNKKCCSIM